MITDRDICMGAAIKDRTPSSICVEEVMTGEVYAIQSDETVEQALQTMQEHKIRRLPVTNLAGELEGIVSMNDIVLFAKSKEGGTDAIDYGNVVNTYAAICQHPLPSEQTVTASM